ncbi:MAG: glycosyl hydrolase family 65 protein, partial [Acidobacteriota bacterium]|nr:glycosyl hydrolase family 65 protein [Acidobacteriota bacterium]
NVKDGCHIASMGGFWMTLIYGFAGMRDNQGEIRFTPRVPGQLGSLKFPLEIRGRRLEVILTTTSATYTVRGEESLTIYHEDELIELAPNVPATRGVTCQAEPAMVKTASQ